MRPFLTYAIGAASAVSAATGLAVFASSGSSEPDDSAYSAPAVAANTPWSGTSPPPVAIAAPQAPDNFVHAFYFTRGIYNDGGGGFGFGGRRGGGSWATDYPKSDHQFLVVLRRLTNLDAFNSDHAMRLDDPELNRYPFLYILEVGRIGLSDAETKGLRDYMLKGGFVFVDDFWGDNAWYNFEEQMRVVLPEYRIEEMSMDHEIFKVFYEIKEPQQMPSINHWRSGESTECGGCAIHLRGIFDENRRLMMLIAWNTDNGDAWEWAEQPDIPLKFTTFAYQLGVNSIVYAMSH